MTAGTEERLAPITRARKGRCCAKAILGPVQWTVPAWGLEGQPPPPRVFARSTHNTTPATQPMMVEAGDGVDVVIYPAPKRANFFNRPAAPDCIGRGDCVEPHSPITRADHPG